MRGQRRASFASPDPLGPSYLTTGEELMPRWDAVVAGQLLTQRLSLHHFTVRKTQTINNVRSETGGTPAAATPTYCAIGIYTVPADDTGTYTLVASTANDTTLWATANTAYTTALLAPWAAVRGTRCAAGPLCVSGATLPNISCRAAQQMVASTIALVPKLVARLNAQATLPATFLSSALTGGGNTDAFQLIFLP